MKMSIRVTGGEEIQRKLELLPREVVHVHLVEVAEIGGEIIRAEAVRNAERIKDTGNLAANVEAEVARETTGRTVTVRIGPNQKAWYGRLVEMGHAAVGPGQRRAARRAKRAGTLQQQFKMVPPHPWLRPAFDAKKEEARERIGEELGRRLERIWRKR